MNKSIAKVVSIFIVVCLVACQSNSDKLQQENTVQNKIAVEDSLKGVDVALTFINDYVANCNKMNEQVGTDEWVESNHLVSKKFIYALQTIINNSYKEDPETGLDFNPIFDAQDWPEEGFELESFNTLTGYYVVRGKKWKEFRLAMKIINENGKWLVDGCGIVNIPYKYRIKR